MIRVNPRYWAALILVLLVGCKHGQVQPPPDITQLADAYVAQFVVRFPEQAELSGMSLPRHDGLSDNSLVALADWERLEDGWAELLSTIDPRPFLGKPEWVTLGFLREAIESSRQRRVCRSELWQGVSHMFGWQVAISALAQTQPVGNETARREALARYGKLPRFLETEIANLRAGVAAGFTSPRRNVELVVKQLDGTLALPVDKLPIYSPAARD